MELRHIRYFLAVAAERNFTRAAEQVGIGQPPLSLQIRDLEREVGARLFHRIPQGAELTAAGKAFQDLVRGIPRQVEHAAQEARRAARGELGALSVGYTASSLFNPAVAAAIRNFRRACPDVALRLEENNTTRLSAALHDGSLDVAFLRPGEASPERLRLRLIGDEPLLAVLPRKHAAARRPQFKLGELRDETFLLFPRDIGPTLFDTITAACRKAGFEPALGPSVPQIASIIHMVAAELGVSLVPSSMQHLQTGGVVFREPRDVSATTRLSLAWRRSDTSPFVKNFLACAFD